jgi:hypothetical protein
MRAHKRARPKRGDSPKMPSRNSHMHTHYTGIFCCVKRLHILIPPFICSRRAAKEKTIAQKMTMTSYFRVKQPDGSPSRSFSSDDDDKKRSPPSSKSCSSEEEDVQECIYCLEWKTFEEFYTLKKGGISSRCMECCKSTKYCGRCGTPKLKNEFSEDYPTKCKDCVEGDTKKGIQMAPRTKRRGDPGYGTGRKEKVTKKQPPSTKRKSCTIIDGKLFEI